MDDNFEKYIQSIDVSTSFLKNRSNGILLTDEDVEILDRYGIDYQNCSNVGELVFQIEEYLNELDSEELENLSLKLSEFQYYNETNK